ncbi:HalOD1 output domain-containing protein [Salinigranum rubrum]|uniref:HalOD1 output domain-containing protein n=1 Tax=Salinigranum rubrum TaxID=755307 RepID=UPI0013A5BC80|nr:HalOD1 output domain-containing protein [Salinigranum rubrum]
MTDRNPTADDSNSSSHENESETVPPAQPSRDVFRSKYGEDELPSKAVISAVSAVTGVEPTELECLHDSINPDTLDTLMDGPVVIGDGGGVCVNFQYSGYRVSVRKHGSITILESA